MTAHRAVIEAGPAVIRRLCCGTDEMQALAESALGAVDDPLALVDERPVSAAVLWTEVLCALAAEHRGVIVLHPSWWSSDRILVVATAAKSLGDDVAVRPRSWLLAGQVPMVEIAAPLVAIVGSEMSAVPRLQEPRLVAAQVAARLGGGVLIDAPDVVAGAAELAKLIADAVTGDATVLDDAAVARLARMASNTPCEPRAAVPSAPRTRARIRTVALLGAAGVAVLAVGSAISAVTPGRPGHTSVTQSMSTTILVEGRVALTIPSGWRTQRVISGPGSARVQVTSPTDSEVALHVTQSPTPGDTLAGAADRLRRAIDAEPAGVFVDFDPSGQSGGRPAVTYREIRATHDVRWTVLLDDSVRISVGCQSRPTAMDAVRDVCEQAVRTAHAVD